MFFIDGPILVLIDAPLMLGLIIDPVQLEAIDGDQRAIFKEAGQHGGHR